jgi:hypothetical protein
MNSPPLPTFTEDETLGQLYEPVAKSRRDADQVKKEQRITVVIGNPPYKNQASGQGGWIESGSVGRIAPMNRWMPPLEWSVSAHAHHLKNLYVYFWRWATLQVFGSGWHEATGEPEHDRYGIICFITVAGFLNGPGFQKMRGICAAIQATSGWSIAHQKAISLTFRRASSKVSSNRCVSCLPQGQKIKIVMCRGASGTSHCRKASARISSRFLPSFHSPTAVGSTAPEVGAILSCRSKQEHGRAFRPSRTCLFGQASVLRLTGHGLSHPIS